MKRQQSAQPRNNLNPPRINTPNNQEFIQDYFSGHQPSPFSPAKNMDNNMFNGMYYPNNQMIPNNGPLYNTGIEGENYELKDNNNHKQKWDPRGMPNPSTPIHTVNDMNQFGVQMQYRTYEMYGDHQHQQPLMTPPPYIRNNVSYMNGGPHGNEEMMVGMNHVLKDQNSNLLSPVVMENTGGAQNNKKANLYKTELCHSFEETGHCRYGSKCQFAHSEKELRHVDRHPKYKTEICKTFWEQGTCPYGKRCCFIHKLRDVSKKEEVPGTTPTTPVKKNLQESTVSVIKTKTNSTDNNNTLSEGETIAVTGEEGETTTNNHSRSGSDSTTAASITEEVIASPDSKTTEENATTLNDVNAKTSNAKAATTIAGKAATTPVNSDDVIEEKVEDKKEIKDVEGSISISTDKEKLKASSSIAIKTPKSGKTPSSSLSYSMNNNYSTSFNNSMNNGMMNSTPRRKPSSGQPTRINSINKSMNLNVEMYNSYNGGMFNMNSMSYQPASPLDTDFMFNNNNITDMSKTIGQNSMSTSFPANDYLDEKMLYKMQNLNIQNTPPHTPVNSQRTSQNMMSPGIFMKQPLNINANQSSSNLFLKQAVTASPFAPGSSGSFLSPKQAHMAMGIPPIPMIDDETSSLKGSVSGKGSDYGDDTRSEDASSTTGAVGSSSGIFLKQAGSTPKAQTTHPFLKVSQNPSTPKNTNFLPSTPQSITSNFLSNVSPLPSSRMGTSLPTTPMHPNSYSSSTLEDIFNGSDFSRPSSTGINVATSPFTTTNDLTQYMMPMAANRENSLDSIKSPSQLFYRQSSTSSLNPINTTSNLKGNGGFGNMNMGGMGMAKNRSDSFDYGINNFLTSGNAVASPSAMFNSPLASSFNNSYLNSKNRSESVDFGQMSHSNTPKDSYNSMVGSLPTLSIFQSINEGIPDSPFSNHGSINGSPLNSANAFIDLNAVGMNDFGGRRKSYPESSLMSVRLPTVPEGRHPNIIEEEEEEQQHRIFSNNTLTDEGILKFSKEHFGLDDKHSKSLLGAQGGNGLDIKGSSILGGNIFHSMSPSTSSHNFF